MTAKLMSYIFMLNYLYMSGVDLFGEASEKVKEFIQHIRRGKRFQSKLSNNDISEYGKTRTTNDPAINGVPDYAGIPENRK